MAEEGEAVLEEEIEIDYSEKLQYLNVIIEDESFGLSVMKVREIREIPDITPVPNTPEAVFGVCNVRGEIVAVVDVRKVLKMIPPGATSEIPRRGRMIVVHVETYSVCIIADSVVDVLSIPESKIEKYDEGIVENVGEYVEGVYRDENQKVATLLDIEKLLDPRNVVYLEK